MQSLGKEERKCTASVSGSNPVSMDQNLEEIGLKSSQKVRFWGKVPEKKEEKKERKEGRKKKKVGDVEVSSWS